MQIQTVSGAALVWSHLRLSGLRRRPVDIVSGRWQNCFHGRLRVVQVVVVATILERKRLILRVLLQHVWLAEALAFADTACRRSLGANAILTIVDSSHAGCDLANLQLEGLVSLIEGNCKVADSLIVIEGSLQEEKSLEEKDIACGSQPTD